MCLNLKDYRIRSEYRAACYELQRPLDDAAVSC
jgi:hypothetical protein